MITVTNLNKAWGEIRAVNDLSFEVAKGEVFGLLGPNGAGKTTAISIMVGLIRPDSGTVEIDGKHQPTTPIARESIGVAPQAICLYDELTAAENLNFFGSLYSLSGAKLSHRVDWALEFAGLQDRRRHRVATFSGGMKRRLNLASALVHEPQIVMLDEPTVGVDPQSRNHLLESIAQLQSEGLTIIYTTHYMEEAQRLCDRVAIIDHGKLLALDAVPKLIETHGSTSTVTAEFRNPPADDSNLPARIENNRIRFETVEPIESVANLMSLGHQFESVEINQPNLESVFLHLTGRSLRD